MTVHLVVAYPETYPDVIPDLSFENIEDDEEDEDAEPKGELSPEETTRLVESLNAIVRAFQTYPSWLTPCRRKRV